jgi:glycerol-3-phosphate O-acyltransferase
MCLVAINGNILRLNTDDGGMEDDLVCEDRVVYTAGPVIDCPSFREHMKHMHHFREDKKQAMVDEVMTQLERLHEAAEKDRLAQ